MSNYGLEIAQRLATALMENEHLDRNQHVPFVLTVENACLIHDIGNPPFGHMGEYAIGGWFAEHADDILDCWAKTNPGLPGAEAKRYLDALSRFDGNAQSLRVVSRLQWFGDEYGLNLTCALLAASMKYLGESTNASSRFFKKPGFFPSELEVVKESWKALRLNTDSNGLPQQRHPLAFIMEAADDIAYCLSDIEDALEMGVVTEQEIVDGLSSELADLISRAKKNVDGQDGAEGRSNLFHWFRILLSRKLVDEAVRVYMSREDEILNGTMTDSLFGEDDTGAHGWLEVLKKCANRVYTARPVVSSELGGLNAVRGILDAYLSVLMMAPDHFCALRNASNDRRFRDHPTETLLASLIPPRHLKVFDYQCSQWPAGEPAFRAQLIADYVSGMTDSHALKIYNMISGTSFVDIE